MNVLQYLQRQFAAALTPITAKAADYSQLVRPAQEIKFGDYQANCAMPLKKEVGGNPRDIAQKIIDNLPNKADFASIEIAGPGFVNLKLADDFLAKRLTELINDDKLGIEPISKPKTMVIDCSSPNVANQFIPWRLADPAKMYDRLPNRTGRAKAGLSIRRQFPDRNCQATLTVRSRPSDMIPLLPLTGTG